MILNLSFPVEISFKSGDESVLPKSETNDTRDGQGSFFLPKKC